MKKNFAALLGWLIRVLFATGLLGWPAGQALAQAGSAQDLIVAVNALRASNGLPALQAHDQLMQVAQAHSDYQASIGQVTHYGASGSSPKDRATAAGYGGGGTIFIAENVAGGDQMTIAGAFSVWQDELHMQAILGADYQDIGVGVAISGGTVYYTLVVGNILGATPAAAVSATPVEGTPQPTAPSVEGVVAVTPDADGAIIHIVQPNETLSAIAQAYAIALGDLLALNNLTMTDTIRPGESLLIRAANTATPTKAVSDTATPRPATPTQRPTRTPTRRPPTITVTVTPRNTPTPTPALTDGLTDPVGQVMAGAIILLGLTGAILLVIGSVLKRRA